jgi:response regulator RpfG family c-di-GMP phosphodiesterase
MSNFDWKINEGIDFLNDDEVPTTRMELSPYRILIVDDDIEVHTVTKMILNDFTFEDRKLAFFDAYSGKEAIEILNSTNEYAVIFLDVVMETSDAGLKVVEHIRNNLFNDFTRIILRTGQPGEAPEERIIREYDINDYRLKTDLTIQRLTTSLLTALRSYRDLVKIDQTKKGLERIIRASSDLFIHNSIDEFFSSILHQLGSFYQEDFHMVCLLEPYKNTDGFVTVGKETNPKVRVASGKYLDFIGQEISRIPQLKDLVDWMSGPISSFIEIKQIPTGILIRQSSKNSMTSYIYIEGARDSYDIDLISLFLTNYSIALENYIIKSMISDTQKEIIETFGEVIEKHFDDTSSHVKRISSMMYNFALLNNFSYQESEILRISSTLHDIGKVAIPDDILKKPGKLTVSEFEIMKSHTVVGYDILNKSKLEIFKTASDIALYHHERFDGKGYPEGISGRQIPFSARMMSIIDVFDAITNKRVYKQAQTKEEAINYLIENKDTQFDPQLIGIFVNNIEEIIKDIK